MISGSLEQFLLEKLSSDEKYKQILGSITDDDAKLSIDKSVKTFLLDMSKCLTQIETALTDPETREQFNNILRNSK